MAEWLHLVSEENRTYDMCIIALKEDLINIRYIPFPIDREMMNIIITSGKNSVLPTQIYYNDCITYDDILILSKFKYFDLGYVNRKFRTNDVIKNAYLYSNNTVNYDLVEELINDDIDFLREALENNKKVTLKYNTKYSFDALLLIYEKTKQIDVLRYDISHLTIDKILHLRKIILNRLNANESFIGNVYELPTWSYIPDDELNTLIFNVINNRFVKTIELFNKYLTPQMVNRLFKSNKKIYYRLPQHLLTYEMTVQVIENGAEFNDIERYIPHAHFTPLVCSMLFCNDNGLSYDDIKSNENLLKNMDFINEI